MIRFALVFALFLLRTGLAFSNPGPAIQFLVNSNLDTLGIVIGTDTFAMLSASEVRNVNTVKITLGEFKERNDSLLSIIKTHRMAAAQADRVIASLEKEKALLLAAAAKDKEIIDVTNSALAAEKKKKIPWMIGVGIAMGFAALK